jgi:hypothetical protein
MTIARRCVLTLVTLLIVYGNVAVVFQPRKLGFPKTPPVLPLPMALHDAFLLPGMFTGYTRVNYDIWIEGELMGATAKAPSDHWATLNTKDFFPRRHAISFIQLWAAHPWDMLGTRAQHEAWTTYAKQIRHRQNLLHPEARIDHVRFGIDFWPQTAAGYRAGKLPATIRRATWFTDQPMRQAKPPAHAGGRGL